MARRLLCAVLGLLAAANGAAMLIAGARWYEATPGVSATGPFNPHFVADIGVAYLFPMVKLGLGYAKECVRIEIGGRPVAVARAA